jgi:spore maturation protein CgeB
LVFFDYFTGIKGFQGALTDRSVIYTSNVKDLKNSVEHLHGEKKEAQHLNEQQNIRVLTICILWDIIGECM